MRFLTLSLGFLLICTSFVAVAQPPSLPSVPPLAPPQNPGQPAVATPAVSVPPLTSGATNSGAIPAANPASRFNDTLLSRFEPLAACPVQTQSAVRSVLLSANWLTRMNQSHGRFIYGFNPALRQPLARDHDLHQARAALAMAQLAKFTGDEKQAAIASQAILMLMATTKVDPLDAHCRVPLHSSLVCNRVGFAAVLALAVYALPGADPTLLMDAEQLCEFLHKQCRADGSIHYTDGNAELSPEVDPAGLNEYPGLALQALVIGNTARPSAWKTEVARRALDYYRKHFQAQQNCLFVASMTPAFTELFAQTKWSEAAAFVFEMNDWLCRWQIPSADPRIPQWAGGFRSIVNEQATDIPSGFETGLYLQSLACATQLARLKPDLDRYAKFKAAASNAAQYLVELQYVESNTRHFENAFRANMLLGAFHLSPTDGTIRIDATATPVSGLLRFLELAALKD